MICVQGLVIAQVPQVNRGRLMAHTITQVVLLAENYLKPVSVTFMTATGTVVRSS
jgi:hypothetical protein